MRFAMNSVVAMSFLAIFATASVSANVGEENGNFYIGYTDLAFSGGMEDLKIERTYNSKSSFRGVFGWGWSSLFETRVVISGEGCAVVQEWGGGANHRFCPADLKSIDIENAAEMITKAARKDRGRKLPSLIAYKKQLIDDPIFRNDEWQRYLQQRKVKSRTLPIGTQLQSNRFGPQTLTRTKQGYVRTSTNKAIEQFDLHGRLLRISDEKQNWIELTYTGMSGKLKVLTDNQKRSIELIYNQAGQVEQIRTSDGRKAEYQYNNVGELVRSQDVDKGVYTFKYDSGGRHNLTEIGYNDKTTLQVSYYGREFNENVQRVKNRDGAITEYDKEGRKLQRK